MRLNNFINCEIITFMYIKRIEKKVNTKTLYTNFEF